MIVRVNVVTVNNNSPIQDYVLPDDYTKPTYGLYALNNFWVSFL